MGEARKLEKWHLVSVTSLHCAVHGVLVILQYMHGRIQQSGYLALHRHPPLSHASSASPEALDVYTRKIKTILRSS
jgi:hypothetical protein